MIEKIWRSGDETCKLSNVPGVRVILAKCRLAGHIRAIMIYGEQIIFTGKYTSTLVALADAESRMLDYVHRELVRAA